VCYDRHICAVGRELISDGVCSFLGIGNDKSSFPVILGIPGIIMAIVDACKLFGGLGFFSHVTCARCI